MNISYYTIDDLRLPAKRLLRKGWTMERFPTLEEALARFSPHLFYPTWNEECTGKVMDSFGRLMKQVPVYLLSCLPDREAVEVTCNKIWGE